MLVALIFAKFLRITLGGSNVKTLRKITAATILCLTLSVCVFAGQIEVNGVVAPPPPPTQTDSTTTAIILLVVGLVYP
jgi:hypothetical protein